MRIAAITAILFLVCLSESFAQDTTIVARDTTVTPSKLYADKTLDDAELIETANKYDPRIAGLYSAVLPGLGQIYNRKYWKVPIIYAGFYLFYYNVDRYNDRYQVFRKALLEGLDQGAFASGGTVYIDEYRVEYDEESLRNRVNRDRRERDYLIIIGSIFYLLNIADAHIDAHLREFDVNEKLKLTVDPTLSRRNNSINTGLSLTLQFR